MKIPWQVIIPITPPPMIATSVTVIYQVSCRVEPFAE
jgi:hypothetical protein